MVSATFYTDTRRAGVDDDLSASIHYGEAAHAIDEFMRAHAFKLIEAAAEGVAEMLLDRYPRAYGVRVKLEKPWAPVGLPLQSVSVEIRRDRAHARIACRSHEDDGRGGPHGRRDDRLPRVGRM